MSVLIPIQGSPQPPDFSKPADTNRNTVFSVAVGEKARTIISVSAVNEDGSARILRLEHYNGVTYRTLWRKSIAANETGDMTSFPVGLVVLPGCSIVATAAVADQITVTINTAMQS